MVSDNKCIVYVPENDIARIIGKQGKTIDEIEKKLGISIDVQELKKDRASGKESADFDSEITKNSVKFYMSGKYSGREVDIYIGEDYLLTAKTGKAGVINISKDNKIGSLLVKALNTGEKVKLFV